MEQEPFVQIGSMITNQWRIYWETMLKKFIGKKKAQSADLHRQRGLEAFDRKDYHVTIEELTKAVENGTTGYDFAELYTVLGRAYQGLSQYGKAISAHKKALEINPNYYQAWNNLGITYFSLNNYEEAEKCHQKALSIEPTYAFAIASLGALYIHKNHPQKAIEVLEEAIVHVPGMAVAHSNLALAYGMVGKYTEAEKSLKQAILLGYKNWQDIQERIDNLKEAGDKTSHTGWLPSVCPRCGAPISASTVVWTGNNTADCSYCGTNIERKFTPTF